MNDYKEYVEQLACSRENEVFFNSGPVHAAVVMSRIFKHSNDIVRIFSGGFNGDVSNDEEYLKYLEGFLKKPQSKIICIVENDLTNTPSPSRIFNVLKKYPSKVEIYLTTIKVRYTSDISGINKFIHFTVGDKTMLRIETGINEYVAQVNFGDEPLAKKYIDLFDDILKTKNLKKLSLCSTSSSIVN